jgi:hypothetical protein
MIIKKLLYRFIFSAIEVDISKDICNSVKLAQKIFS